MSTQKSFIVESPSGSIVNVNNMNAFCKDVFGVVEGSNRARYHSSFSELFSGVRAAGDVQGWKRGNLKNATGMNLVTPSGANLTVSDMEAFCKDVFGINTKGNARNFAAFSRADRKTVTVNGWKRF